MIAYLARIVEGDSWQTKELLSDISAETRGQALISPGTYNSVDETGTRELAVSGPVLVDCAAKELGKFTRVGDAQAAAAKVSGELMYIDEARIVARHLQHSLLRDRKGVIFKMEPNTYEAFRETVARVQFYTFAPDKSRDLSVLSPGKQPVTFNAVYRSVQRLS
jgi:hypothetical protein